jgi:ribose/xylose/arabinose/galactoside ABC-type transport system permease subunit
LTLLADRPVALADAEAGMSSGTLALSRSFATPSLLKGGLVLVLLVVILSVLAIWAPFFFRVNNVVNILVQASSLGLLAMAMAVVMIGGGIDLSLPANMAFAAILGGLWMAGGGHPAIGVLVMLLAGAGIGLINGIAVAYLKMIPFVVTLATMTAVGGLNVWLTNSVSVAGFPESYFAALLARPGGVPVPVMVTGIAVIVMSLALSATLFGRRLYAVGINPAAARVARVPVERTLLTSYVVAGLLAGLTAMLLTARLGSASANMGSDSVVLDIVSAAVVGGISIYGGVGGPLGALLGAVFIVVLGNGLNLLGVSFYIALMVKGVVIISFVAIDGYARRQR